MAMTTSPMGFADRAALRSHCAAADAFAATACASVAAVAAAFAAVSATHEAACRASDAMASAPCLTNETSPLVAPAIPRAQPGAAAPPLLNASDSLPATPTAAPTPCVSRPTITSTGPMAAPTRAALMMKSCWPSVRLPNFSASFVASSISRRNDGMSSSPIVMPMSLARFFMMAMRDSGVS